MMQRVGRIGCCMVVASMAYAGVVRPWQLRWGSTDARGDELIAKPTIVHCRAVTVHATPADIWPWLVQLGQGRAGLYSYDWLENLVGCEIHSRDVIVPELQHREVGDIVSMRKGDMPSFTVTQMYPERALVVRSRDPATGGDVDMDANKPLAADTTWAFLLHPTGDTVTRLIERSRLRLRPRIGDRLFWEVVEFASFVMGRRMLLGIKERAERVRSS